MLEQLQAWDTEWLLAMNQCRSFFLDVCMPLLSNKYFWFPFYGSLLVYMGYRHHWTTAVSLLVFAGLAAGLADLISVHGFKEVFERPRPCRREDLQGALTLLNNRCGSGFGFVSSHAANHFALAVVIGGYFKKQRLWQLLLLLWAAAIAYSRVYLGVHYPFDVITGAALGAIIGWGTLQLRNRIYPM